MILQTLESQTMNDSYQKAEKIFSKIEKLRDIQEILYWDDAVYRPKKSETMRTEQITALESLIYDEITSSELKNAIYEAKTLPLEKWQKANLREIEKQYTQAICIEKKLLLDLSEACSKCESAWRQARKENNFQSVLPHFQKTLSLTQEKAGVIADKNKTSMYNALLNDYDPGSSEEKLDTIFNDLESFLPDFTQSVLDKQKNRKNYNLTGKFSEERQKKLCIEILKKIGFDFDYARLDKSDHPFSCGTQRDIRITTRYDTEDFTSSLYAAIHEMGHGLYEFGLPKKWYYQPVGHANSMSIHESQSLFFENTLCRSLSFIKFATPIINNILKTKYSINQIYDSVTNVNPGYIRVDADEVTYPLHIILRYKIEKTLISGDLTPKDLPYAWNELMKSFLHLDVPNNKLGCLQDIHWYGGDFGYFPSYLIGAITAYQLFDTMNGSIKNLDKKIEDGTFYEILSWLEKNIHGKGSLYHSLDELLEKSTEAPLEAYAYKTHLKQRYLT